MTGSGARASWLQAPLLAAVPDLVHGFTGRDAGDAAAPGFGDRLAAAAGAGRTRFLHQVHGARVARPEAPPERPEADGWAGAPPRGTLLGILTADCLPVLLCHPPSGSLGAVHGGWRGLAAGVIPNTLKALGAPADEIRAVLGPHIGPCCYQVDAPVRDAFGALPGGFAPWDAVPDRYRLDLAAVARAQLLAAGVRPEHLQAVGGCTACEPDRYFSYRREGTTGRMCAFIGWGAR
ncbi:MAG: hypothetical protein Kow0092_07740 [Deferrisomatales bacterium]